MVAHVATVAFLGLEARAVEVQVQIASGLPKFLVVGLPDKAVGESRERVRAAIAAHKARTNAEIDGELLEAVATPDEAGRKLLAQAAEAMRLSARGYTRILRIARTIADLAGAPDIGRIHIAEALSYRRKAPRN